MRKVGVVGIDLTRLKGEFGSRALSLSGNNFGNMLFTNAVYNQLPSCFHIGFNFDPERVKKDYNHIVIPASNWINNTEDWGFLAELLDKTELPITLVGLGSQLNSVDDLSGIAQGTLDFLSVVSSRSNCIGVRGEFTKKIMENLGFSNVMAIGCPSIFNKLSVPTIRTDFSSRNLRIGIGPTRYHLEKNYSIEHNDKQRQLYQFAISNASSIYYQSEAFEIAYLNREETSSAIDSALQYYGVPDKDVFHDKMMSKGMYHKDLDQWLSDAIKDDVYIGTRIHGAVAAILAGTPAILITHDNRTIELANVMGVPNIHINDFDISRLSNLRSFLNSFDFGSIKAKCDENIKGFIEFYKLNGLKPTL